MSMKISFVFVCGLTLATACLITNCPKGGKRGFFTYLSKSINKASSQQLSTQCIKCGPQEDGRCVGPAVCCGPHIGCLIASPGITSQCSEYSLSPPRTTPTCLMPSGIGICTLDGICCNSESCRIESTCEADPYFNFCPDDLIEGDKMQL